MNALMFLSTHTLHPHTHVHPASLARYQSSPGRPGWWRGNRTCTSWQAERALCAGWTGIWLPCCALNAPCSQRSTARNHNKNTNKTRRKNEKGGAPQSGCSLRSPITEDCKEIHLKETPPPPFPQTPTTIHSPSSSSSSSRLSSPPSPPHQGASNCQQLLSRLSVRPLGVLPNTTQLFCHDRSALTFRRRCSDLPPNQSTRLPGKNKTSPNEIKCSKYTEGPPSCCLTRFCFIMLQRFNQERRTSSVLLL